MVIGETVKQIISAGFSRNFPLKLRQDRESGKNSSIPQEQDKLADWESSKNMWQESFRGFYQKYHRAFWFYIFKLCGDEGFADDIFQESFVRYLQFAPTHLDEFRRKAYLYKIAYHLFIDHKRRLKTEQTKMSEIEIQEREPDADASVSIDMERTFKLMKPKERNLLWLAYVEGYSHAEIAGIIAGREESVKVQLFRARKKMARILQERGYKREAKNG